MKLIDDDSWKPLIAPMAVIEGKEPIMQVTLDEEGDWLAFGITDSDDLDCVSLEEALTLDPTLATLPDMRFGQTAWRDAVDAEWYVE
ncbi:MAG: hypothetical protein IKT00_13525 [Prevotella sp.]|nr:hypothetical protein [Prevotella sp.]